MTEIIKQISDHMNAAIDAAKPKVVIPNTGNIDSIVGYPLMFLEDIQDDRISPRIAIKEELKIERDRMKGFRVAFRHKAEGEALSFIYYFCACPEYRKATFFFTALEKHGNYFIAFYERA